MNMEQSKNAAGRAGSDSARRIKASIDGPDSLPSIDVLFTPADFSRLPEQDLSDTTCVVFDVLRATSSMVTALATGAAAIIPVAEIAEALEVRSRRPEVLLAGERDGLRISSQLTGTIDFELGNSPREFTSDRVSGRVIAMTTTNGTRALRACAHAQTVLVGSFLNLAAVSERLLCERPPRILLICSGTFEQTAYEDILGAGALCESIWDFCGRGAVADSAPVARKLYLLERGDLQAAMSISRNGSRLLRRPELRDDVELCSRRDTLPICPHLNAKGEVTV